MAVEDALIRLLLLLLPPLLPLLLLLLLLPLLPLPLLPLTQLLQSQLLPQSLTLTQLLTLTQSLTQSLMQSRTQSMMQALLNSLLQAVLQSMQQLLLQPTERNYFFSYDPIATDHSSWPHKGLMPTFDTSAQESYMRMSYEYHMPERHRSLNTIYAKAIATGREYFNAIIPKMRPMLKLIPKMTSINAVKHMKQVVELAREIRVVKELKRQKENIMKVLQVAEEHKIALDRQLVASVHAVQELEYKLISAVDLSAVLRNQRDDKQFELENIVREVKQLRKRDTLVTEVVKMQKDNLTKELEEGRKQILALQRQLADSARMVKELEDKNGSALELLTTSKKERDETVQELEDIFISAVDLSTILWNQRDDIQFELDTIMVEHENIVREVKQLRKRDILVTEEVKIQKGNLTKELEEGRKQILALQRQLADSARIVQELEDKNDSALELLTTSKKERDEIQLERDNALREAEELRQGREDVTADLQMMKFFSVFSLNEIKQATQDFNPSLIIGRGGYGNVFKGTLRNTDVAIKMLHPNSSQGCSEFQKEVDVLSRVRHPNLITLIGTCPEDSALIYEYLPNGSLEDRLAWEKNKTPPLSWQTRTRIAVDICSALIFLHSNKPHGIVHGDLKPANVLLDANLVSKLGDFGICRLVHFNGNTTGSATPLCETTPKGTLGYMDPEFISTGELTAKSDVFAFGIVLLQLLTRGPAIGLINEVQSALKKGGMRAMLDASVGDWPLVQANELARLALWCCEMNRRNRPDLVSEVWSVLEQLKV